MRREQNDSGVTLLEVVVAMAVMSVVGAMFTTSIVQTFRVANRVDAAATAQSQLNVAFLRLDKEIRYAEGISTPGAGTGSDHYVEYLTKNTGTQYCGQLRFDGAARQLQWRRWRKDTAPGGWSVLASNVSTTTPFTVTAPGTSAFYQALTVRLTASIGADRKESRITFAALNSAPTTRSETYCVEGRSAP